MSGCIIHLLHSHSHSSILHPQPFSSHSDRFPFLSKYAQAHLIYSCMTTKNVEREFLSASFILMERRTNLQPDKLDNILLVRSTEKQLYKK